MPKMFSCSESDRPKAFKTKKKTLETSDKNELLLRVPAGPNREAPLLFRGQYIEQLSSFLWVPATKQQGETSCK